MNKLDPFEKLLNAKLQNNEVELNFDSWNAIEKNYPLPLSQICIIG